MAAHPFIDVADLALRTVAHPVSGPDCRGGFPEAALAALREADVLLAPLPVDAGGRGFCEPRMIGPLRDLLTLVGRHSLAVGRIYEGHVNALALVLRYGGPEERDTVLRDARQGHLFGVWNTEPAEGGLGFSSDGEGLTGAKSFASGAGFVTRALVTARTADGRRLMLVANLAPGTRSDLSAWRVQGMRATATGTVDFAGLTLRDAVCVGEPDDYFRQPFFSAGAWRFLAVQLGGIEAVFDAHRGHLRKVGRGGDPHQRARLGSAATAVETARLFVAQAARLAADEAAESGRVVAYVNLARGAVERAGLDVIELAQRSVGLAGFLETHPLERLTRDLATYLRQPAPDYALTEAAAHILGAPEPVQDLWRVGDP